LNANISAERPKGALIREIAREFEATRKAKGKILIVAGAAVVHTGAAEYLERMIEGGYVDLIISGNAFAVYDIESALFGTALGVNLEHGALADAGHENHMRAINLVRAAGGISNAVKNGTLTRGTMRELLLCPPDYYGIEYEINPWMSRARGAETELAQSQWQGLHQTLASLDSKIELVPPQPKLPDMVFTANAGLAVGKKFIPSNF